MSTQSYDAHPAFLLKRSVDSDRDPFGPERLGLQWIGLPNDERARRARSFRAALLAYFAENHDAVFKAQFRDLEEAGRFEGAHSARRDGLIVVGRMSPSAASALADTYFSELVVSLPSGENLEVSEGWRSATVRVLDPTPLRSVLDLAVAPSATSRRSRPLVRLIKWAGYHAQWLSVVAVALVIAMWLLPSLGVPRGLAAIPAFIMIPAVILGIGVLEQRRTLSRERSDVRASTRRQ
jgi:hypothetical protein